MYDENRAQMYAEIDRLRDVITDLVAALDSSRNEVERLREANANNLAAWTNEVGHLYEKIRRHEATIQRVRDLKRWPVWSMTYQRYDAVLAPDLDTALESETSE